MKNFIRTGVFAALLLCADSFNAQIGNFIKNKINSSAQNAENNAINKGTNSVNNGINKKINGKDKNQKDTAVAKEKDGAKNNADNNTVKNDAPQNSNGNTTATNDTPVLKTYSNYDFKAGEKIIFEDNFVSDEDGEFPAHWKLESGQAVVNKIGDRPAFFITDGNYGRVFPRMKTNSYLGNQFTLEYDVYYTNGDYGLMVFFQDATGQALNEISFGASDIKCTVPESNSLDGSFPAALRGENFADKWHHFAIAYKDKQIKIYIDQYRVLVVPDCNSTPAQLQFGGIGSLDNPMKFTNVKLAEGGSMNMLNKIMTDGKIVTHGITFDVNKSTIKPESMGVLNEISKLMKENPALKFEIDGHTDSDGDDAANLKLSQARAESVKKALSDLGVDNGRLTTKGFGESKPMSDNTSPEGKAMNRRVEFVKQP